MAPAKVPRVSNSTEQVWFAGAHSDVGGGYLDEEARQKLHPTALDDITLDWMLKRVLHYYSDFPVRIGKDPAWPQVTELWASAPQHEARMRFYRARPLALRSIANCIVPIRRGAFEVNVCHDRHADPVGEMLHISVLERLGRLVKVGQSTDIYAPRNLLVALSAIEDSYADTTRHGAKIRIVDWSGRVLAAEAAIKAVTGCRDRLRKSFRTFLSDSVFKGALP